jgi:hypothetical protein
MYKNKFLPCIREEGRIDLVKGERIQDTIFTLRDTLFTIKKVIISGVVDPGSFIPDLVYFLSNPYPTSRNDRHYVYTVHNMVQ